MSIQALQQLRDRLQELEAEQAKQRAALERVTDTIASLNESVRELCALMEALKVK